MQQETNFSDALRDEIKGTTVRVPDLRYIFQNWPQGINPHHEQVAAFLDKAYDNLFPDDEITLTRVRSYKIQLCGAAWWPNIELRELCVCTWLLAWLFLWDDQFDDNKGSLCTESENSNQALRESISWVSQCLRIPGCSENMTPSNPITHSFHIFGDALSQNYAPEQRDAYLTEFISYTQAIEKEQRLKDSGIMPSPEAYIKLRLDSSAIGLVYAIIEFSVNRRIPEILRDVSAMKTLREETISIIFLVNDIASFTKELRGDCLHNYIPVAYSAGSSLQDAILEAVKSIEERVEIFEKAADELMDEAKAYGCTEDDVLWFIQVCKTYCTGNFQWSMDSVRYDIRGAHHQSTDGQVFITL